MSSSTDSFIGRRFGPYEVTRLIGIGGMGGVYLAERADKQFTKKVALKLVDPGRADENAIRHFQLERETLASLDHPNIVKLLDAGVTAEGLPYLIMDYVEGTPIDLYCDHNRLTFDRRLELFLQVCDAVQYAHRRLIVHRDIKPRNILVTPDGIPKLLDFGIAKLVKRAPSTGRPITSSEKTMIIPAFTLEYASPEQLRLEPVTTAVDVYALGVLLYDLLTSQWPYAIESKSEVSLAYAICESEPQTLSQAILRADPTGLASKRGIPAGTLTMRRRLHGDLDAIGLKAIQKQPELRYTSALELAEDIRCHLSGRPVQARPQTLKYRLLLFARRNRGVFAASALAVLIAIFGLIGIVRQSRIAEQQRTIAQRRFDDLRKLLGGFLFDVHDNIRDLPGSTTARAMIIDQTSKYLGWLSEESSQESSLQIDLADAYIKLAGTQGDPYEMNLGRSEDALQNLAKAQQVIEAVVKKEPGNLRARRYAALIPLKRANIFEFQAKIPDAISAVKAALPAFQQLAVTLPNNAEAHQDLALAFETLADLLNASGDTKGSLDNLRDSLDATRTVLRIDPKNFRSRRAVSIVRMKIGDARRNVGEVDRALSDYQSATDALAALWNETKREDLHRIRGILLGKIAQAHTELTDYQRAVEGYREQRAIYEDLIRRDPADKRGKLDLASALRNESEMHWFLDNMPESLTTAQRALEILDSLAGGDPTNAVYQERQATVLLQVSDALVELKRPAEAKPYALRGLATKKELAGRNGVRPDVVNSYAEALLTIKPEELRDPSQALPVALKAAEMSKENDLVILDTLGRAYAAANKKEAAMETLEKALTKAPQGEKSHMRQVLQNHLDQIRQTTTPK